MATVTILAVLGSIASFLIIDAVDGYTGSATSAQLHAEMSVAFDRAVREVRKIELDSAASGVAPNMLSVNSFYLQWTDSDGGNYQLSLSGADVKLEIDGGGLATLLTDVTVFSVRCYDEDNVAMPFILVGSACDPIRRVVLDVTVSRNGVTESLRTKVFIRSTMSGA